MRDYWLSKLFFDLQNQAAAEEYRAARGKVLDRYPLKPEVRAAVERDDVAYVARLVNPYLLRFYFHMSGMPEDDFVRKIRASAPAVAKPDQTADSAKTVHRATGGPGEREGSDELPEGARSPRS